MSRINLVKYLNGNTDNPVCRSSTIEYVTEMEILAQFNLNYDTEILNKHKKILPFFFPKNKITFKFRSNIFDLVSINTSSD